LQFLENRAKEQGHMPRTEGGNAPARSRARAHASPPHRRRASPYHRPAKKSACEHAPPGRFLADEPAHHAACARSPRHHRSARRARTPRIVVPRVLTCRSHHCKALRHASALGFKRLPSSSPAREPAARRSTIAAAAGELTAPLAPATGQTLLALH
jgi:hypothetical protein